MRRNGLLLLSYIMLFHGSVAWAEKGLSEAQSQQVALGQDRQDARESGNSHPEAQWFPQAGLGLFIHWGLASSHGGVDLSWGMLKDRPWDGGTLTPNAYYALADQWHAEKMDFDKIIAAAKEAGFVYAVLTTKHHDGFTLWPSSFGDMGTKQYFGGRDFVKEYVAACHKYGLKVGFYYSPPDWWFDRQYRSFGYGGQALDMDHKPVVLAAKPSDHDQKRAKLVQGQVRELLTGYGKIDLLWFDGGHGEIPNSEVRSLQPGIVINRRNGSKGDYGDSEGQLPEKRFKGWFETCETCWPSRKWQFSYSDHMDTAAQAIEKLVRLRAWGGNLLANVGPMGDGRLPPEAAAAWKEMGEWMAHSRESVIGAGPGPWPDSVNMPVTTSENAAYIHFLPGTEGPVVWKNAPKGASASLLRTNDPIPLRYEGSTLHVVVPPHLRTRNVDVVKINLENKGEAVSLSADTTDSVLNLGSGATLY